MSASPPSTSVRPSRRTGGSTAGMALLARTALTVSPSESSTSSPDSRSVVTRWTGIGASSRPAKPTCRRTRRSSPVSAHRASRAPASASIICGARSGKTSSRRSAAHVAASRSRDAGDIPCAATKTALSAPAEVPTSRSGVTPRSPSACSMPTWTAPRLPPPERTKAVVIAGRPGSHAGPRRAAPCIALPYLIGAGRRSALTGCARLLGRWIPAGRATRSAARWRRHRWGAQFTRRPSAQCRARSSRLRIFPAPETGSASAISTVRGQLVVGDVLPRSWVAPSAPRSPGCSDRNSPRARGTTTSSPCS